MKCPHCNKELKIPNRAYRNVEAYRKGVNVTTECCEKLIFLSGQMRFSATTSKSDENVDSWGVPYKN